MGEICGVVIVRCVFFFFSSRRRHTRCSRDWSSDVCSSDLASAHAERARRGRLLFRGHGCLTSVILGGTCPAPLTHKGGGGISQVGFGGYPPGGRRVDGSARCSARPPGRERRDIVPVRLRALQRPFHHP